MKSDCNLNTKELGNIVRNMLAEKNKTGRQAFEMMEEDSSKVDYTNHVEYMEEIDRITKKLMDASEKSSDESISNEIKEMAFRLRVLNDTLNRKWQ